MTTETSTIIEQTERWVQQLIVKYNICPFARREVERKRVRYVVAEQPDMASVLQQLLSEAKHLDEILTLRPFFMIPQGLKASMAF